MDLPGHEPEGAMGTAALQWGMVAWYGGGRRAVGVTTGTGYRDELGVGFSEGEPHRSSWVVPFWRSD